MSTESILIVDDDQISLDLMSAYVGSYGFSYDTAEDGEVAIKKLREGNFTIVITDIMMPRVDGMQLLKYIRENHPQLGVIVITGYGPTFSYTKVIKEGASDFITKPFNPDELEAKLNRLVRELNLVRQLEQHSILDSLTNLYNRRYFDSRILNEAQRAERQRYKVFLQMIDVDNLKGYNDTAGHQGGDELLRSVSGILLQSVRENVDWAFRYGGDEFGVVFTHVDLPQVISVADRILGKYKLTNYDGTGLSIGIAGFIHYPGKTWPEDIYDLVTRADKALYSAKYLGKNQIVFDESS